MEMTLIRKRELYPVLFDDEDYEIIRDYLWYIDQDGYAVGYHKLQNTSYKKWVKMHRLLMMNRLGDMPQVDHINRNRLDNRRANLRPANAHINGCNTYIKSKTGYLGVRIDRTKTQVTYRAVIDVKGKRKHIKGFKSPEEAAIARDGLAIAYYGEAAVLNFKIKK
jgi:hypothetical protein